MHDYDNCHRFTARNSTSPTDSLDSCPSTLFDHDSVEPCDEYVYENKNTVVYDVCNYVSSKLEYDILDFIEITTKVEFSVRSGVQRMATVDYRVGAHAGYDGSDADG